jgi:hypothetical protein
LDQIQYKIQYLTNGWLYKWKGEFERSSQKDYEYGKSKLEFNQYLFDMFKNLIEESKKHN